MPERRPHVANRTEAGGIDPQCRSILRLATGSRTLRVQLPNGKMRSRPPVPKHHAAFETGPAPSWLLFQSAEKRGLEPQRPKAPQSFPTMSEPRSVSSPVPVFPGCPLFLLICSVSGGARQSAASYGELGRKFERKKEVPTLSAEAPCCFQGSASSQHGFPSIGRLSGLSFTQLT